MRLPTPGSPWTRRSLAGAAAIGLFLTATGCGSASGETAPGTPAESTAMTVGSPTSLSGTGLRNAITGDHFEDEGLDVEATRVVSGNDAVPQLVSGDLQIAQVDTTTALQAMEKGVPIVIVAAAGLQSTDGGNGVPAAGSLLVEPDSDIQTAADIEGRTVGIHAINSQVWMNIRAVIDADGGDSSKVEFIEVPGPQSVDMLLNGEVEVASASEPLASSSVAAGDTRLVHSTDIPGKKGEPSSVYIASKQFVAEHPDAIQSFITAVHEGQAEVNEDKELGKQIAIDQLDYTNEQLENGFILDYGTDEISPEEIQAIAETAVEYGILTEVPDPADVLVDLP